CWTGLVARTDATPPTKAGRKNLKYVVTLGSVQQKYLEDVLHPSQQYNTYDDTAQLFAALKAKQIDAVLIDLPVALPAAAASNGDFKVFAQVKVGGQVGIVMIQPSPNQKALNTMVRQMLKNGTLKNLEKKYYFAAFGGVDPDKLPAWGERGRMEASTQVWAVDTATPGGVRRLAPPPRSRLLSAFSVVVVVAVAAAFWIYPLESVRGLETPSGWKTGATVAVIVLAALASLLAIPAIHAVALSFRARRLESSGDIVGARHVAAQAREKALRTFGFAGAAVVVL